MENAEQNNAKIASNSSCSTTSAILFLLKVKLTKTSICSLLSCHNQKTVMIWQINIIAPNVKNKFQRIL